jgi:vacuolar-type H+-ATPase subunit H
LIIEYFYLTIAPCTGQEKKSSRRETVNENRIKQILEIEKKAQENYETALRDAQRLPAIAEQEAQAIIEKARAAAQEEARQIVAKARAEEEVSRILAQAEDKNRQLEALAMSNFDRAVNYILDRVTGRE